MHIRHISSCDRPFIKMAYAVLVSLLLTTTLSHADNGSWTYYYDSEQIHFFQTTVSGSSVVAKVSDVNDINGSVLTRLDTDTGRFQWFFDKDIHVERDRPSIIYEDDGEIVFWGSGIGYWGMVDIVYTYKNYTFTDDKMGIIPLDRSIGASPYFKDYYGNLYGNYNRPAHGSDNDGVMIFTDEDYMQPTDSYWTPIIVSLDGRLWRNKSGIQYAPVNDVINNNAEWQATTLPTSITIGSDGPDDAMYFSGPGLGLIRYKDDAMQYITGAGITDTTTVTDFWYDGGDVLWTSTAGLLIRYDGDAWEIFTPSQEGYDITSIDVSGDSVWAGTSNGLICFRYGDLTGDITIGEPKENVNVPSFATFDTGHTITSSPAISDDGTIYIGTDGSEVYAVNPDMTEKWSATLEDPVMSTPAVSGDGSLFLTSGIYLYKILSNGTIAWRQITDIEETYSSARRFGYDIDSSPAIDTTGNIYVGNAGRYGMSVSCFNTYSSLLWREELPYVSSSPALTANNTVIVGTTENVAGGKYYYDTGWAIHAFPQNGIDSPWTSTTSGNVSASAAIGRNGTIFIGGEDGAMRAYTQNGELLWTFQIGQMIQSSAAVGADGTVYFGSHDQRLYALNSDGTLKWTYDAGAVVFSSPAIGADGTIYFGARDGFVIALNSDGSLKWRYKTGGKVNSSPVLAPDGTLYIGSEDGNLYAFDTGTDGLSADAYWPCFKHDITRRGQSSEESEKFSISGRITEHGEPRGGIEVHYTDELGKERVIHSASDGLFEIPNLNPGTHSIWLSHYKTRLFPYRRSITLIDSSVSIGDIDIDNFPVKQYMVPPGRTYETFVDNDRLYFRVIGKEETPALHAYDMSFNKLWTYELGITYLYHCTVIGADRAIYISTDTSMYAINPDGTLKWEIDTPGNYQFAIANDGTIYATCQDNKIRYIDPETGTTLNSYDITSWYQHPPVIGTDGDYYVLEGTHQVSKHTPSGNKVWSYNNLLEPCGDLVLSRNNDVFVYSKSSRLYLLSSDGVRLWTKFEAGDVNSTIAVGNDWTIYSGKSLSLVALAAEGETLWEIPVPAHQYSSIPNHIESITLGDNMIYATTSDAHVLGVTYAGTLEWYEHAGKGSAPIKPIIRADGTLIVGDYYNALIVDVGENGFQTDAPWPYANHDPRNTNNVNERINIGVEQPDDVPSPFMTVVNFPNPFNPTTTISYTLPITSTVTLSIYSSTGQKVTTLIDETLPAGAHTAKFDGTGLASGIYFARLEAGGTVKTSKMLLVK